MRLRGLEGGIVLLECSARDLLVVNNALNEVCNGLDLVDFATRMGVERDDALGLLHEVSAVIDVVDDR
jgi:hypothetical protein